MSLEEIMVFPRRLFPDLPQEGTWLITQWPEEFAWRSRAEVERDEQWLQPIPYLLISLPSGEVWCYRRVGGDGRLYGASSCGVGGHVEPVDLREDLPQTLATAARREVGEELLNADHLPALAARAWLYEGRSDVGRVHIGVIFHALWRHDDPPAPAPDEALEPLGFLDPATIAGDSSFELWSRLAARFFVEHEP